MSPFVCSDLESNEFEIVGGKICGQVDVRTELPRILPVSERIPKFPLTPSYEFGADASKILLKDRFVLIGEKDPITGDFYQNNYAAIDFQGVQLIKRESSSGISPPLAIATTLPFALPVQVSADGHHFNVTQRLSDNGKVIWFFDFLGPLVKVSFSISGMAAIPLEYNDANSRHQLLLSYHIKSPNSGSSVLTCPVTANYMGGNTGDCQSNAYHFSVSTNTTYSSCKYTQADATMSFEWPMSYSYDGNAGSVRTSFSGAQVSFGVSLPLGPVQSLFEVADLSPRLYPFGELEPVNLAVAAGDDLGAYNADYQFTSVDLLVNTHPFRSTLNYGVAGTLKFFVVSLSP